MSTIETDQADHTLPTAPKVKRRRKVAKRRSARPPADEPPAPKRADFAGVTVTKCCDGCTEERCLISTVAVCKHPFMTGEAGCGKITIQNREAVKRIIKRQKAAA